jgi:hypothetical protein
MRMNITAQDGKMLAEVITDGSYAYVTLWTGKPVQAFEQKYALCFPANHWPEGMDHAVKCDDAVRVAVSHWINSDAIHEPELHLVCDHGTERFTGVVEHLALPMDAD